MHPLIIEFIRYQERLSIVMTSNSRGKMKTADEFSKLPLVGRAFSLQLYRDLD